MKQFLRNLKTQTTYEVIYETEVPQGVPFLGDIFVTLKCIAKYPKITDQTFVTLPKQLVNKFFSNEDVIREED